MNFCLQDIACIGNVLTTELQIPQHFLWPELCLISNSLITGRSQNKEKRENKDLLLQINNNIY